MSQQIVAPALGLVDKILADIFDRHGRYVPLISNISKLGKTEYPQEWIKPFVRHRALDKVERFLPFYTDPQKAFNEGLQWQIERGWIAGWKRAFSWVGVSATFEVGARPLYPDYMQVHLSAPIWGARLDDIIELGYITKSSLAEYHRIIHGYDLRPVVTAHSTYANAIFAKFSGVRRRAGEPLLSIRHTEEFVSPEPSGAIVDDAVSAEHYSRAYEPIKYAIHRYGSKRERKTFTEISLTETIFHDPYEVTPESWINPDKGGGSYPLGLSEEQTLPIAAVKGGGRSSFAGLQAVFVGARQELGELRRYTVSTYGGKFKAPRLVQLRKVPEPIQDWSVPAEPAPPIAQDVLEVFNAMPEPPVRKQVGEEFAVDEIYLFQGLPPWQVIPTADDVSGGFIGPLYFYQLAQDGLSDDGKQDPQTLNGSAEEVGTDSEALTPNTSDPWSLLPWSDAVEFGGLADGISDFIENKD